MTTWVKVYNSMPQHPKSVFAGERAMWLFTCGLCYANEHLTDGFVARHVLPVVAPGVKAPEKLANSLVLAGLWHEVQGGWQIHDYDEHQRSSEEVRGTRSWDVERKSLYRDRDLVAAIRERDGDQCRYCGSLVDWRNRRGTQGGTYDHVVPRGGNTFENVVVACKGCNSRKGARTPTEAGMPLLLAADLEPEPDPGASAEPDRDLARVEESREETEQKNSNSTVELGSTGEARQIFDAWAESTQRTTRTVFDSKRRAVINKALKTFPTADLLDAVQGWQHSPHHRGENPAGTVYNDLELLLRDAQHIEKFRDLQRGIGRSTGRVVPFGRKESPSEIWRAMNPEPGEQHA